MTGSDQVETDSPISVLFCSDGKFFQHLGVTLCSLLLNNVERRFHIFVVSDGNDDGDSKRKLSAICDMVGNATIEFRTFDGSFYQHFPVSRHISPISYLRLFATEFLPPELDRILYLDGDLIVNGDIKELWTTDLGDNCLAAVSDPYPFSHRNLGFAEEEPYFNAGVLLISLNRWREANALKQFLSFIEQNFALLECHDQDVLNVTFRQRVRYLDYRWNFQARMADCTANELSLKVDTFANLRRLPDIVHFTTHQKPWNYIHSVHYAGLYFRYLRRTSWAGYVPPDRTALAIAKKTATLLSLRRQIRWSAPRLARKFRDFKASGARFLKRMNIRTVSDASA